MFGEIHDAAIEGMRLPIEDSQYVITLLSKLRKIGYEYLALEVNKNTEEEGHSYDIVSFYKAYIAEGYCHEEEYPNAKPGWIELIKEAIDIGYKIRFIDVFQRNSFSHFPRDEAMFEKIREEIFDEDRNAKIIVYIGANHIGENETQNGIYLYGGKQKPLGYYLNKYTKGNNYSVYMGNTYDSPVGSDLFISYFIWETFHKIDSNNCSE
jgi:hypothetical protein